MADLAYEIESNKVKKEVAETQMQVEIIKKQKEIELVEQEALRKEKELDATIKKQADAEKYKQEKNAEALKYQEIQNSQARAESIRLEGKAKAEAKKLEGMAEVEIIRAKGQAEADAMKEKTEAFKQYNDAAVVQMIIEKVPEIATAIANPLSKIEKIVIVDNGNSKNSGASKVTRYVTDIMGQLPDMMEALTGIDINDYLKKKIKFYL